MSKVGFVYILINDYMPNIYKLGCTERSPHERAAELSSSTGVPAPFRVLCYIECFEFQAVERKFHEWLREHRISNGREFFDGGIGNAIRTFYWFPERLAFCVPRDPLLMEWEPLYEYLDLEEAEYQLARTRNPFIKKQEAESLGQSTAVAACSKTEAIAAAEGRFE